jgi:flagellin
MPLTINTNVTAMGAQRSLNATSLKSSAALAKLSSGSRIVTAKDDAAALSIANGLRLDLSSLRAAQTNVQQASSVLQIADGGFSQIGEVLTRMKTLSANAQSDNLSATERGFLNTEFASLRTEITRIAGSTEFNGVELLGGAAQHQSANIGSLVGTAQGFVGFEFNPGVRVVGDSIRIAYNSASGVMTIDVFSAAGGAGNALGSQSIDIDTLSGDPFDRLVTPTNVLPAGQTYDLDFAAIGVKIKVNSAWNTAAAIAGAAFANDGVNIVAGTATAGANLNFLVGVSTTDIINVNIGVGTASALGVGASQVDTVANAQAASAAIDAAMNTVNTQRATLGALMSRLDFAGANVAVQIENNEAARSVLYDVDVSSEMTEFTSKQVLVQAGVSMLAQANQQPSVLLRLLQQ